MSGSRSGRALLLRLCAALYGLAIAISLYPLAFRPALPDQLPGLMKQLGYSSHGPFQFLAGIVVLPLLAALVLRRPIELLDRNDAEPWSRWGAALSMLAALFLATTSKDWLWTTILGAAGIGACVALGRSAADFRRYDFGLVAVIASVWLALIDRSPLALDKAFIVACVAVLMLRLVVAALPGTLPPSLAFAAAPLALALQSLFFARDQRHAGWPSLVIALVTPLVLRLALRDGARVRRVLRVTTTYVIYPLACLAYASATSQLGGDGKPRLDFFEDAQHIVAAHEMMRGERLYRDITPPHGMIQDALLDYAILRGGAQDVGRVLRTRLILNQFGAPIQYALAAAATGSAEAGLLAFFLTALLGTNVDTFRVIPSLAALALVALGIRRRSRRAFFWAGVLTVLAILTSLDFGAYALIVLLVALLRARSRPLARAAIVGFASATVVAFTILFIKGMAVDYVRVTLTEVLNVGSTGTLVPFTAPKGMENYHFFPEVLAAVFDKTSFLYLLWLAVLIGVALLLGVRRSRRYDALFATGVWCVVAGISYAERHHLYFRYVVPPLFAAAVWLLFRRRTMWTRIAAMIAVFLLIMIGEPISHLAVVTSLRRDRGMHDPAQRELTEPRRVRGTWVYAPDAEVLTATRQYVDTHLQPGETFFDFTDRGLLYYLLDRDCPTRQFNPLFYESETLQRDVIARIDRNPRVRIAIVPSAQDPCGGVDCVPNATRAPLVWTYLQQHFQPDYDDGKVAFWRRK